MSPNTPAPAAPNREELTTPAASVKNDPALIYQQWMGSLCVQSEDPVLATKGGALRWAIYQELLQDPHLFAVWMKRIRALQAYDWEVLAASDDARDVAAADEVRAQFQAFGFDRATEIVMDGLFKGFSVSEVLWEYTGGLYKVKDVRAVPQRRIRFQPNEDASAWEIRLLTYENPVQGVGVPTRKMLHFAYGSDTGNPYGHGLGSRAWWPVYFKKAGIQFWMVFAEKYGSPTAVGKLPKGAGRPERDKLLKTLGKIAQDAGIVIGENEEVELLEATKTGAVDCYTDLVRYMDEQLSELVLGETGSTNQSGSGGSRARDQVGNEVRLEVAQADSDLLCDGPFSELARWIAEVNFPGAAAPRVRRVVEGAKDLESLANRDTKLFAMGWERTDDSIRQEYGDGFQRRPGGAVGAVTVTESIQAPESAAGGPGVPPGGPSFAEGKPGASMPSQSLQNLSASLQAAAPAAMDQILKGVEALVDSSTSLTDLQEKLAGAYAGLAVNKFSRLVEEGNLGANLIGRAEVGNG